MPRILLKADLEKFVTDNWELIGEYLDQQFQGLPTPIYTSVDIRESATKFAPVDNNLYPAGFNNLCQLDLTVASARLNDYFKIHLSNPAKVIGLIPESHSKNRFYLDHLLVLKRCLESSERKCILISPDQQFFASCQSEGLTEDPEVVTLTSHSQGNVTIYYARYDQKQQKWMIPKLPDQLIEAIILNHDQSSPLNILWEEVKTPVFPSPLLGWTKRQKIEHFTYYQQVCEAFCQHFDIDPYLMSANFVGVNEVDFEQKEGLELLAEAVKTVQLRSRKENCPVFIKASQGTYGMGISVVTSPEEVLQMNRKTRNKMDVGKNNLKFQHLLVQEGIETIVQVDSHPAEVTIYLINGKSTGGFLRSNPLRDQNSNLNAKGMIYLKYCISDIHQGQDHQCKEAIYCVLARLSTIATALEIKNNS